MFSRLFLHNPQNAVFTRFAELPGSHVSTESAVIPNFKVSDCLMISGSVIYIYILMRVELLVKSQLSWAVQNVVWNTIMIYFQYRQVMKPLTPCKMSPSKIASEIFEDDIVSSYMK